jgi:cytochrome c-type biogenesis protein CcmH
VIRVAVVTLVTLALAPAAAAATSCPTLSELEPQFVCPSCGTTLELSNAPIAERMRAFIRRRVAACDSEAEIRAQLVARFGRGVLAEPPKRGFDLLAWLIPIGGALAAAGVVGAAAWRWSRARAAPPAEPEPDPSLNGRARLEPELERRLEEELARFE